MATLHFIYGPPGAGKTTRARQLGAQLPAVTICEDEWLATLISEPIASFAEFIERSRRLRAIVGPLAIRMLELGTSVVFDFAGNVPAHRAWARGLAEAAGVPHALHVLAVPIDECRRRVHERNRTRPAGLFHGEVSDAMFDAVWPMIVPPGDDEGLHIVAG